MDNLSPAGLRGRVILGKGNNMEELIKRLERVIQTGALDKDGMHPISAETVLEVVKELSKHGTNLAEVGTDAVSREVLKDGFTEMCNLICPYTKKQQHVMCGSCLMGTAFDVLEATPSVTPKQRTGKWIKLDMHRGMADHKCTACEQECYVPTCMGEPMYAFCPNCGSYNGGEQDDSF